MDTVNFEVCGPDEADVFRPIDSSEIPPEVHEEFEKLELTGTAIGGSHVFHHAGLMYRISRMK